MNFYSIRRSPWRTVTLLIWLTLGLRESGIVAVAIPVTLALTLTVSACMATR
jgi:hypothetical protein